MAQPRTKKAEDKPRPQHADPAAVASEPATTTAVVTVDVAPRGARRAVQLTPQAIASIRDDEVRGLKQKEVALRAEMATQRDALRSLLNERDAEMRKISATPKVVDPRLSKCDAEFEAARAKRDELARKLDNLRLQQATGSRMRDEVRCASTDVETAIANVRAHDRAVVACREAVAEAEKARDAMLAALTFKSAAEAEEELNKIDQKIAAATRKGEAGMVRELGKQRNLVDRARKLVLQSYAADSEVMERKQELKDADAALQVALATRKTVEERRAAMRDALNNQKDYTQSFREINSEMDALRTVMDRAKDKKRELQQQAVVPKGADGTGTAIAALNRKLDETRTALNSAQRQLEDIADKVPFVDVPFPAQLRGEIVGRGGATLDQLRADFGVALDFTPDRMNCLTFVGAQSDIDAAKEALSQMVSNLERVRKTATLVFDPSVAATLIGAKGSNVDRIQNISGARVRINEGNAVIVGTQEAVDAAVAMLQQQIDSSQTCEIPFQHNLRELVYGRGGSTVRSIEQDSGAKRVRIDRDRNMITAVGSAEAIEKVKKFYADLISDYSAPGFTMRVDQRMLGVIIGRGGSTVSELQTSTGAIISTSENGTVSIRGPRAAIEAARTRIEDLTRRDEVRIPFDRILFEPLTVRTSKTEIGEGGSVSVEDVMSPVEELRRHTGCEVVVLKPESLIIVRGRKENVNHAVRLVQELLDTMHPDTISCDCADLQYLVLSRSEGKALSYFETVRAQFPGVLALDFTRANQKLKLAGDKAAITAAMQIIQAKLDELKSGLAVFPVSTTAASLIIGVGGIRIKELCSHLKCDISINKDNVISVLHQGGKAALDAALIEIERASRPRAPA